MAITTATVGAPLDKARRDLTDATEAIVNMQLIDDVYRAAGLPPRGT